jgi:cytochrome c553
MTDDKGQTPVPNVPDAPTPEKPEPTPEKPEGDKPAEEPKLFDAEYVRELRSEAAKYRVEKKELEKRLADLETSQRSREEAELADQQKWQELADKRAKELEAMKAQLDSQRIETVRLRVAAEFGLNVPIDDGETLADRLRGTTEEELRADAAKLAKWYTSLKPAKDESPDSPEPEKAPPTTPGAGRPQTTAVPGGKPAGKTDEDRRREYLRGSQESPLFQPPSGGGVVWNSGKPD